ncbi:MAG: sugar transferase [Acidobacteriota bacterium]|nr:sugar transferase [Acidobacteriota bacterium]
MTRKSHVYIPMRSVVMGLSEALLATLALLVAMVAYLGPMDATLALGYQQADVRVALIVALFVLCMYYFDLYDLSVLRNPREVVTNLIQCFGSFFIFLGLLYTLFPFVRLQMSVVLAGTALAALGSLLWRQLFRVAAHWPAFQERVVTFGEGAVNGEIAAILEQQPELGYRLVSQVAETEDSDPEEQAMELRRLVDTYNIRRVSVAMGERRGRLPVDMLLDLKEEGVTVEEGSDLYEIVTGKVYLESLRPSTLLFSPTFEVSTFTLMMQRTMAVLVSLSLLVITLPVMFFIALAIKLDSHGPAIFRQKRVGLRGQSFTLYKFRSMRVGVDGASPAQLRDERFTRFGSWLRSSRLDELPQLWNILRGDMQLVGPRPFVPEQEATLVEAIPFYKLRWSVRPGVTGWAQINRGYNVTLEDNAEKLAYDLFYIKHFSIGLDLLIIFQTVKTLLLGRGAR